MLDPTIAGSMLVERTRLIITEKLA